LNQYETAAGPNVMDSAVLDDTWAFLTDVVAILGLHCDGIDALAADEVAEVPAQVTELMNRRKEARDAKNWAEADLIRDEITALGFVIEDGSDGATVRPASSGS
jgi:cysteinyl-tRNA synthetase